MPSRLAVPVMGTIFSVDIRDPHIGDPMADALARYWRQVDATFSTYRPGSDISRLCRGEILLASAHPDVALVLRLCARASARTRGYFCATATGRLDPSGLVKGWSIENAVRMLRAAGATAFCINGGGDVYVCGEPEPGRAWAIGVADPADPAKVLTVVPGRDLAVATSGTAERGAHVINPLTGRAATDLVAVTVTGPSLTWADAYATAALAMGDPARAWLDSLPGYEAIAIRPDRSIWSTSGFQSRPSSAPMSAGRPGP